MYIPFSDGIHNYKHDKGGFSVIDVDQKKCTCPTFFDKAICKHLVAVCLKFNIQLNGLSFFPKRLQTRQRKKQQYKDLSWTEEPVQEEIPVVQQELPKKRGRQPKISKALDLEDVAPRRSSRKKNIKQLENKYKDI